MKCFTGLLLLFAVVVAPPAWSQVVPAARQEQVSTCLAQVIAYGEDDKPLSPVTGFFVKGNRLITNRHLLAGAVRAAVRAANGQLYPVVGVLDEDVQGDLLLLLVDVPPGTVKYLEVSDALPKVNEQVYTLGSVDGKEWTCTEGQVTTVLQLPPAMQSIFYITPAIPEKASGGPLLNSAGQVIGVSGHQIIDADVLTLAGGAGRIALLDPLTSRPLADWSASNPENWINTVDGIKTVGAGYLVRNDYTRALAQLKLVLKLDPGNADAWFLYGLCHEKQYNWQEAEDAFNEAIRLNPACAEAHAELAFIYCDHQEQYAEAIDACRRALRYRPDFARAHTLLGLAYVKEKRYYDAVKSCKEAVRLQPADADAHRYLAKAYERLGAADKALEERMLALAYDKDLRMTYTAMGKSLTGAGGTTYRSSDIAAMQMDARREPTPEKYYRLGWALSETGNPESAIEAFKQAVLLKSDYTAAYDNLLEMYGRTGRWADASQFFREAVRRAPDCGEAQYSAGYAAMKQGDPQTAVLYLYKATTAKKDYAEAYFCLGLANQQLGRGQEARAAFNEAIRINPGYAASCP